MKRKEIILYTVSLLLLVMVITQGCVYSRLLSLKKQLKESERYVKIDGEVIMFLQPLLLSQDVLWLMKSEPTGRSNENNNILWTYLFKKEYSETGNKENGVDLMITLFFESGKLQKVKLPRQISSILPALLQAVGNSDVDKQRRNLLARWNEQESYRLIHIPTRKDIEAILGSPFIRERLNTSDILSYKYKLQFRFSDVREENITIQVAFLFHHNQEQLVKADMRFNDLSFSINFNNIL